MPTSWLIYYVVHGVEMMGYDSRFHSSCNPSQHHKNPIEQR